MHTVEIHVLFLELISTGSWLKLALVLTGQYPYVKAGANKDDAASVSMSPWPGTLKEGEDTEAYFQESR